jgi:hypothetical protein
MVDKADLKHTRTLILERARELFLSEGIFLANRMGLLQRSDVSLDEMIETAIDLVCMGMIGQRDEWLAYDSEDGGI